MQGSPSRCTDDLRRPVADAVSDDAAALLGKLSRIPDAARVFSASAQDASTFLRLSPELMESLLAKGLPHRQSPDGPLFDPDDLKNVSMHLGAGSAMLAARRFWATGLNPPDGLNETHTAIYYQPRCPAPGHPGRCEFRMLTPTGIVERAVEGHNPGTLHEAVLTISTRWPVLSRPYAEVIDVSAHLEFMFLPVAVRTDVDFTRRTGLSGCEGSARLLVDEAARRGLAARERHGLIVAPPYSAVHSWAEFRVDDRWVPVDPVLLRSMIGWGTLDPAVWHERRSIGPIVVAFGDHRLPLVTHAGQPAALTLSTRRIRPVVAAEHG